MKRFPDILKHKWGNWRGYKSAKRQELKRMIEASGEFQIGCAWIPRQSLHRFDVIRLELRALKQELSCKEWGR